MTSEQVHGAPPAGVGGAEVKPHVAGGIACWFSEARHTSAAAKQEALAFHGVVSHFFQTQTVLPFRFPTTMPDEATLATWLESNSALVKKELARLHDVVQMELYFGANPAGPARSGRSYLEGKRDTLHALEKEAAKSRAAVSNLVAEWRQKETREGLRCYALVRRGGERVFLTQLGTIRDGARVSGPWPPSEFLDPALTQPQ
jgi:hypothetical protein